jgi:hypothetical protein
MDPMNATIVHRPEPHEDHDLIDGLEPDQIVSSASRALPRMRLGRGAQIGLWALRIFVLFITAMVIYTFVAGLG